MYVKTGKPWRHGLLRERPYTYLKHHPDEWIALSLLARECDSTTKRIGGQLIGREGVERIVLYKDRVMYRYSPETLEIKNGV